jgi:gas vesicle protein
MSSGKVFLGLLAGLAAGALLGVLFAPDKGSATRKKLSKKGEDYTDAFNEFLDTVSEKLDDVQEEVSDITEKRKSKTEGSKKETKTAAG